MGPMNQLTQWSKEIIKSEIEGLSNIYIVNVYGKYVVNVKKGKPDETFQIKKLPHLKKYSISRFTGSFLKDTNQNVLK